MDKKAYEYYKKIYEEWKSIDWKSRIVNLRNKYKDFVTKKRRDPTVKHQDLPQEVKSTLVSLRKVIELFFPILGLPKSIELARDKAIKKFKIETGPMSPLDKHSQMILGSFPGLWDIIDDIDENYYTHFQDEIDDDRKQRRETRENRIIERQTDESDNIKRQQYLNMYFLSRGEEHPVIAKMTEKKHR